MRLQPIIYTNDTSAAVAWYSQVLGSEPSYRSDMWTTFDVGGSTLAVHRVDGDLPANSRVAISLVADVPLEDLVESWAVTEVEIVRGIQDETFGRSLVLQDPESTHIQVNEHS